VKLALFERLSWSIAVLAAGALLPWALIYWVASRGFQVPPSHTFETIADYSSRPFDNLAWATVWHLPPFLLLAIVCFVLGRHATRRWLATVALAGIAFITIPMIPRSIHSFKDTYRRENDGEGAEFFHFGTSILSSISLGAGLCLLIAIHRHLTTQREPRNG
jgi:hypothetical protein